MRSEICDTSPSQGAAWSTLPPLIEVISGQRQGAIVLLDQLRTYIGRSAAADINLHDAGVVGKHAALHCDGQRIRVEAIGGDVGLQTGWLRRGRSCYLQPPVDVLVGTATVRVLRPADSGRRRYRVGCICQAASGGPNFSGSLTLTAESALALVAALGCVGSGLVRIARRRWWSQRATRPPRGGTGGGLMKAAVDPRHHKVEPRFNREHRAPSIRFGLRLATFAVMYRQSIVTLCFKPGEMPAPFVMEKVRGASAARMIAQARHYEIPIIEDERLTRQLFRHDAGALIAFELYRPVAGAMRRLGVLDPG